MYRTVISVMSDGFYCVERQFETRHGVWKTLDRRDVPNLSVAPRDAQPWELRVFNFLREHSLKGAA